MKNKTIYFLISVIVSTFSIVAQDISTTVKTDTIGKTKNIKFIGLPIAFYTPETGFAVGGGAQVFLLKNTNQYNSRLSNVLLSGIYTTNSQIQFEIKPQLYINKGNYFIDMRYFLNIFPNTFWGIGGDTPNGNEEQYDQTSHNFRIAFLKRLPPKLNFGFEYVFQNNDITEVEAGGILDSGTVTGAQDNIVSGLGAIFNLDSRDSTGSPLSGRYYEVNARFSSELFGATLGYQKFKADLRTYERLSSNSTLAMQVYIENTFGDAPFQDLATFGGGNTARGYFKGRFIDKHMYIAQVEYRWRFKPRWTTAAFVLVGEVVNRPNDFFQSGNLKSSAGAGLRFKVFKSQDTWLRFDVGIGKDDSSGVYFGVNESF